MPAKKRKINAVTSSNLPETPDLKESVYDETEDIYDKKQREEMLEDDEISAAENAFIEGSEIAAGDINKNKKIAKEKKIRSTEHDDTPSVQMAEKESIRDSD